MMDRIGGICCRLPACSFYVFSHEDGSYSITDNATSFNDLEKFGKHVASISPPAVVYYLLNAGSDEQTMKIVNSMKAEGE